MAVQVKNSTFQMNHFYYLPNSNSVTLKNWTAVAHSQQYRPSNDKSDPDYGSHFTGLLFTQCRILYCFRNKSKLDEKYQFFIPLYLAYTIPWRLEHLRIFAQNL